MLNLGGTLYQISSASLDGSCSKMSINSSLNTSLQWVGLTPLPLSVDKTGFRWIGKAEVWGCGFRDGVTEAHCSFMLFLTCLWLWHCEDLQELLRNWSLLSRASKECRCLLTAVWGSHLGIGSSRANQASRCCSSGWPLVGNLQERPWTRTSQRSCSWILDFRNYVR